MTTLLIISCIWLWVMLGLWACQMIVNEFDEMGIVGFFFTMISAPMTAFIAWAMFGNKTSLKCLNPIIWRKK